MFKKHSIQMKLVKDEAVEKKPTLMDSINEMTPEELEEFNRKMVRSIAIHVGAIVLAKVALAVALGILAKRLDPK